MQQKLYDGKPVEISENNLWLNYINYEKSLETETHSNVIFIIEKALTYLCASPDIWREYIEYVAKQTNSEAIIARFLGMYRTMLIIIDKDLVFHEADLQEYINSTEESRRILRTLAYFQPLDLVINRRLLQLEMRCNDFDSVKQIFESLVNEGSFSIDTKLDLTQVYARWLESKNSISDCLVLLETMIEKLNYNKLLVSLYVNYLVRHQSYEDRIVNCINIYEKTLKRFKDMNNCFELIHACKLYKSFLRLTCNELDFVRKVESIINRRIPDSEGQLNENSWILAENQLAEEKSTWSKK